MTLRCGYRQELCTLNLPDLWSIRWMLAFIITHATFYSWNFLHLEDICKISFVKYLIGNYNSLQLQQMRNWYIHTHSLNDLIEIWHNISDVNILQTSVILSFYSKELDYASLKAYSLISNIRVRSQKFQNLNFLHLFVAFFQKIYFPKGI